MSKELMELARKELGELRVQAKDLDDRSKKKYEEARGLADQAARIIGRIEVLTALVHSTPLPKYEPVMGNTD